MGSETGSNRGRRTSTHLYWAVSQDLVNTVGNLAAAVGLSELGGDVLHTGNMVGNLGRVNFTWVDLASPPGELLALDKGIRRHSCCCRLCGWVGYRVDCVPDICTVLLTFETGSMLAQTPLTGCCRTCLKTKGGWNGIRLAQSQKRAKSRRVELLRTCFISSVRY